MTEQGTAIIQYEIFRIVKFADSPERIFGKLLVLESRLPEIWNDFVFNYCPAPIDRRHARTAMFKIIPNFIGDLFFVY